MPCSLSVGALRQALLTSRQAQRGRLRGRPNVTSRLRGTQPAPNLQHPPLVWDASLMLMNFYREIGGPSFFRVPFHGSGWRFDVLTTTPSGGTDRHRNLWDGPRPWPRAFTDLTGEWRCMEHNGHVMSRKIGMDDWVTDIVMYCERLLGINVTRTTQMTEFVLLEKLQNRNQSCGTTVLLHNNGMTSWSLFGNLPGHVSDVYTSHTNIFYCSTTVYNW